MRLLAIGAAVGAALLAVPTGTSAPRPVPVALSAHTVATAPHAQPSTDLPAATLTEVVQQYCVVCHNDALLTGNLTLQTFDVAQANEKAETAERMIRKLRAGMMPPPGIPRPGGDTLVQLVTTLETTVDAAAKAKPVVGERRFQRLSQVEYQNVVRDLLGLEVEAGKWLPPDLLMGAFDNQSAAQPFSTTLLDSFLRAATEVSRLAIGNPEAVSATVKHPNPARVSQNAWDHIEGTPFGTRGGMVVTHDFPADGNYVFRLQTKGGQGSKTAPEDVDISIDGERVALIKLENHGDKEVKDIRTDAVFVKGGQHQLSAAFVKVIDGPYDDRFHPTGWSSAGNAGGNYGTTGLTQLVELWVTGPDDVKGMSDTPSRQKIFTCHPTAPDQQRVCAESILTRLAGQAFRRTPTKEDVADLMKLYDDGAAKEGFEIGVRTGLQGILVSPDFLFRLEREPTTTQADIYRMSDVDLATRLSFFIWDSAPDEELMKAAQANKLSDSKVLEQQVRRMLKDPRSNALATRFEHQWLRLQDVSKVMPEAYYYPDFTLQLADAMVEETHQLFEYLVREDRSLLELLSADYTFLNERLAKHYGIDGVSGDEFRLVKYPDDRRRGILGHGSVLKLTSVSNRTSPVIRGKWVMEVLMGTPPPPPPPNVPAFDASPSAAAGRSLTTRERMEAHAKSPVCNSCHRFIDPIGLALDNFDPTGAWRIRENMAALDTRGTLYDGTPLARPVDLSNALLKRPIPIVRNFTGQLLSYAIGRPLAYYDQPTIRAIASGAEKNGYKISSLILGVVKSDVFQMRQRQTTAN